MYTNGVTEAINDPVLTIVEDLEAFTAGLPRDDAISLPSVRTM